MAMKTRMMLIFCLLCLGFGFSINSFGKNGFTFKIENLSKPEEILNLHSYEDIYKNLILKEALLSEWEIQQNNLDFKYNILAKSQAPDSLVDFGYNPFFKGMYAAYAEHRPFVLSPDMIWILISQGFARHIHANSEKLRDYFVDYSGKLSLEVVSNNDLLKDPTNWEEIFPQFSSQIAKYAGIELTNTLTSNFSTTTAIEKIASQITMMEVMEPYFEYIVVEYICGIPEITLQGTTEDWQKILDRTKELGKYDLTWWTNELEPILLEFVKASKGDINKIFWRNMFKYHSPKQYGTGKVVDGWIVKFFPYDKDGKRNNLIELIDGKSLPEEMVKVDLTYRKVDGIHVEETMLELWAGFIGLEQNPKTFALTPKISWMIKKKDVNQNGIYQKLDSKNIPSISEYNYGLNIEVFEVPENLKKFSEIYYLNLRFKKNVFIPEWLKNIRLGKLDIKGEISQIETEKIIDWFPNTEININRKVYNKGKNGWVVVSGNNIPNEVLELKEIWVLEICNKETEENKLIIPDALKNIKIDNLTLVKKTTPENIEKLINLLPKTNIYMDKKKIYQAR